MSKVVLALGLLVGMGTTSSAEIVWHWSDVPICTLRQQGSSTEPAIEVARTPGRNSTTVDVIVPSQAKASESRDPKGVIRLEPGGDTVADVIQRIDPNDQGRRTWATTEDPSFADKLAHASTLQILGKGIQSGPVVLKAPAAATDALSNCEKVKAREWGIDLGAVKSLKSAPRPVKPLSERFSPDDYPRLALAYSVQGGSIIRLDVGADGQVHGCKSLDPAPYRGFEYSTCDLMQGARFEPALDAAGKPIAAPYIFYIRFRIKD